MITYELAKSQHSYTGGSALFWTKHKCFPDDFNKKKTQTKHLFAIIAGQTAFIRSSNPVFHNYQATTTKNGIIKRVSFLRSSNTTFSSVSAALESDVCPVIPLYNFIAKQ